MFGTKYRGSWMALSRLELSTGKKGPWNQPFTGQQRMPLPFRLKEREIFSFSAVEHWAQFDFDRRQRCKACGVVTDARLMPYKCHTTSRCFIYFSTRILWKRIVKLCCKLLLPGWPTVKQGAGTARQVWGSTLEGSPLFTRYLLASCYIIVFFLFCVCISGFPWSHFRKMPRLTHYMR